MEGYLALLCICSCVHISVHLSISLYIHPYVCQCVFKDVHPSVCPLGHLSVCEASSCLYSYLCPHPAVVYGLTIVYRAYLIKKKIFNVTCRWYRFLLMSVGCSALGSCYIYHYIYYCFSCRTSLCPRRLLL